MDTIRDSVSDTALLRGSQGSGRGFYFEGEQKPGKRIAEPASALRPESPTLSAIERRDPGSSAVLGAT